MTKPLRNREKHGSKLKNWVREAKAVEELRSEKAMLQAVKTELRGYLKEAQEQLKVARDLS